MSYDPYESSRPVTRAELATLEEMLEELTQEVFAMSQALQSLVKILKEQATE